MSQPVFPSIKARKSLGKSGGLAVVALLAVIVFALPEAQKFVDAPWAAAWMPGPKLPGTYVGSLRARLGAEHRLFLNLDYYDGGSSRGGGTSIRPNIKGSARICSRDGSVYEYNVSGRASRDGDDVNLGLSYVDPKLSALGMGLRGPWRGEVMTLKPSDNPFMPDGTFRPDRVVSTADPDDSFGPTELRRADAAAFETACRQLRGA
jgi:hypothetical protein